jgi:hypothetical protein
LVSPCERHRALLFPHLQRRQKSVWTVALLFVPHTPMLGLRPTPTLGSALSSVASRSPCPRHRALAQIRQLSTPAPRPYYFHVGASWAGKPPEEPRARRRKPKPAALAGSGFAPDSPLGRWKSELLASFGEGPKMRDPGEDFFYVQEVGGTCLCSAVGRSVSADRVLLIVAPHRRCGTVRWVSATLSAPWFVCSTPFCRRASRWASRTA